MSEDRTKMYSLDFSKKRSRSDWFLCDRFDCVATISIMELNFLHQKQFSLLTIK